MFRIKRQIAFGLFWVLLFGQIAHAQQVPAPCCTVTTINARTGTSIARVNATGQTFDFRPTDPKAPASLRPGQTLFANFTTKQVSLDGRKPYGSIISGPTTPAGAGTSTSVPAAGAVQKVAGKLLSANPPIIGPVVSAQGCPSSPSGPDLLISSLGFDSTRHVTYIIANCGHAPTQLPFVVDLFFNATRADTVEHAILPALSQVTVVSQMGQDPTCNQVTLRAVADSQNIVAESNESNNELTRELAPPCPDLVFDEIKHDWQDMNTLYSIQVTVANRGTGPTTKTVTIRANLAPSGVTLPSIDQHDLPPLPPGQKYTYHLPGTYALTTSVAVDIYADIFNTIIESNRDNNYAHKILGPH